MGVRRTLFQLMLLGIPFSLVLGTVYLVDPYAMFRENGPIPLELKLKNLNQSGHTMPFSNMMWKLLAFKREPSGHILLGDSRLSRIDGGHLAQVSGHPFFNFGVPGGNYRTIHDLFHYADSLTDLRQVVIQVSFRGMNATDQGDLFKEPHALSTAPLLYLTNRRVLGATALNVGSFILPDLFTYDELPPDHWEQVLEKERKNALLVEPDSAIFAMLEGLAAHCRRNNIDLLLVNYPVHPEIQAIHSNAGLDGSRDHYARRMAAIAPFIDLQEEELFPADRVHWRDPLHLNTAAQKVVVERIWQLAGQGPLSER